jgi:hypothetical protein
MKLSCRFSPLKWARRCLKPTDQRRKIGPRPSFRPCLEILEDRTLLTSYWVTLGTDNNPNGGGQADPNDNTNGDLRYCLTQANKGAGNDILFSKQFDAPIDLQAALPDISQSMTIETAVSVNDTVERSNTAKTNFRIFAIDSGKTVAFGPFTIQNGLLVGTPALDTGAGIENSGTLTLNGTTVKGNISDDDGGGIYNSGNLTLNGGSISGNQAADGGGIYNGGSMSTAKGAPLLSLTNNQASSNGAAIYNVGSAILKNIQITNAIAQGDGGGIYNDSNGNLIIQNSTIKGGVASTGEGGGIFNANTATINQCTFTNCSAGLKGGAIRNTGNATGAGNTVNGNVVTGIPGAVAANERFWPNDTVQQPAHAEETDKVR